MTAKKSKKPTAHAGAEALQEQLQASEAARARLAADYANLERRVNDERTDIAQRATVNLLEKLFPIFDNFYRASAHTPAFPLEDLTKLTEEDLRKLFNYFQGLKMVEKQLEAALSEAGMVRIPTKGELFDPQLHEAISYENDPATPVDHIIDEIEAGWQINGRVVRPAKVRVSRG